MRIVMVCTGAPPDPYGGLGTYIEGLLGGFASQDAEVHLVGACRFHDAPRLSRYGPATIRRVPVVKPWTRASVSRLFGMVASFARLNVVGAWYAWRLHAREKVDLVAVHDWMCAPAGLACALLFRIPVCYHVHSAESFLGDGSRGPRAAVGRFLNRALSRRARLIVVPSSATVAAIPHLAGRTNVVAVSHGAGKAWRMAYPDDAERAALRDKVRSLYAIPEDRRLIVFAGRYAPHKGVTELVEAGRRMVDDGVDASVVMVGTGWPDVSHDERLREQVARLGLGDRVHLLRRWLDTDDLRDHLVAADACVFPSRYEPFGFIALEAMALGARTVVGPGFDEAVVGSAEDACLRTATNDPGELAAALVRAIGDDDPQLGDRARRYVLEQHSWEAAAARTLRAYAGAVHR
jgi:glycosyltransferase involved in cell wall biosynthesis